MITAVTLQDLLLVCNQPKLHYYDIIFFYQEEMKDGKWVFTCQHGPAECVGNLIEVCQKG